MNISQNFINEYDATLLKLLFKPFHTHEMKLSYHFVFMNQHFIKHPNRLKLCYLILRKVFLINTVFVFILN